MTLTDIETDLLLLGQNLIKMNLTYCAIKVESNDRDPCSKIVSKFHERDHTSFTRRRESANFSLCNM